VRVLRVAHDGTGVQIAALDASNGELLRHDGRRVFLACGPLSTTQIVIASLRAFGRPFALQFQPYFLLPLLAAHGAGDVAHERLHTLAQLNLELLDPKLSAYTVHMQIYGYNELLRSRVERWTRRLPGGDWLQRAILGRVLVMQGYLHSSESSPIRLIGHDSADNQPRLQLHGGRGTATRTVTRRVIRKLTAHAHRLGVLPLGLAAHHGEPGEGNHIGGNFPMRSAAGEFETDVLGSLPSLAGVHLVDASVLPDLAATTFTYTVMANAHRIGSAVAQLDSGRSA
jgi:hypothetical protein